MYFIHHQIGTYPDQAYFSFFNSAWMLLSFLYGPFLSGSPGRAHFPRGNFLTLSKK